MDSAKAADFGRLPELTLPGGAVECAQVMHQA